jgi:hypothetical protein
MKERLAERGGRDIYPLRERMGTFALTMVGLSSIIDSG